MKKIIGIILIILSNISFWAGLSIVFYYGGVSLWLSILLPLCCYIGAILLMGLSELIAWLLN